MHCQLLTVSAVLALISVACEPPPDPRRTNFKIEKPGITAQYDDKTGRLKKIDIDQNKNGKLDTFSYWDGTRLDRIEIDLDEDGKIERWEHYAPGEVRKLARLGSSSRGDGVEDTWTYPDAEGRVEKAESDTDRDGKIDKREIYSAAPSGAMVLTILEIDFDASGKPQRRLHYKTDGSFDRAENVK